GACNNRGTSVVEPCLYDAVAGPDGQTQVLLDEITRATSSARSAASFMSARAVTRTERHLCERIGTGKLARHLNGLIDCGELRRAASYLTCSGLCGRRDARDGPFRRAGHGPDGNE